MRRIFAHLPRGRILIGLLALAFVAACGNDPWSPTARLGMVKDPNTGLQIGSAIEKTLVTDAAFYPNKRIKVRVRNTSGDPAFDLKSFTDKLKAAYAQLGYQPTDDDDFGLLMDVNVTYSGQIQTNLTAEYGFLGAAGGAVAGARLDKSGAGGLASGTALGAVSGATLGSIIGSFITDDTYIIITSTTFGVREKAYGKTGKTITFSRSTTKKDEDDDFYDGFRRTINNRFAVYAGGRNTPQSEIAGMVRERMIRIIGDAI